MQYICPKQSCGKVFKRHQDLKTHTTKTTHQIEQIIVIPTSAFDIVPWSISDRPNNSAVFEQMSTNYESELNTEFGGYTDVEIQTEQEQFICSKCQQSTQVEEIKKPKQQKCLSIPADKAYNQVDTITLQQQYGIIVPTLPEIVVDIQICKTSILRIITLIDDSYQILNGSSLLLFNDYIREPIDVDNRVTSEHPEFIEKVSLNSYKFDAWQDDKKQLPAVNSKLGMKKQNVGILGKLLSENDIKLTYPKLDGIYWDIETFNPTHLECPLADQEESQISMLCCVRKNHIKVWLLEKYTFDLSTIQNKVESHTNRQFTYEILPCENDRDIAWGFLEYLSQQKTFNYVCGFNATQNFSKTNERIPDCYDMEFVIRKSGVDRRQFQVVNQKWLTRTELAYSTCNWLPFIIFVDFKQLAHNDIKINEHKLEGYGLNNILDYFGTPNKIQADYIQLAKDSRIEDFDMSHYIAYCAYDCIGLQITDDKYKLFEALYEMVKINNLPLWALVSLTDAQKIQVDILREHFRDGQCFHYSTIPYKESRDKHGALTEQVEEKYRYKYIPNVASCDYTSQYPSAILQNNIAPGNISKTPTKYAVDIMFGKSEEPQIIYFNEKQPLLSKIVAKFMKLKAHYKSIKDSSKEKAYKICVNTIYGVTNQDTSPLFNFYSASAITAFGRISITYAKQLFQDAGYSILSVDTDGVEVVQSGQSVQKSPDQIALEINQKWSHMFLEVQTGTEFIFNNKKKAYLKRQMDKIEMKGFGSKNSLSQYMRQRITKCCTNILDTKPQNYFEIQDLISQFKQQITSEIECKLNNGESLIDYCVFQKFTKEYTKSGIMTKSGKLRQRYGDQSVYTILPYNHNDSRKDWNYAEYSPNMDISMVQVDALINLVIKPIQQFFNISNKTEEAKQQLGDNCIMLRDQADNNKFISVDIDEIEQLIQQNNRTTTYHEKILNDRCKLYFDLETEVSESGELVTIDIKLVQQILFKILDQQYPVHIANGCIYKKKQSYHLIVDVIMTKAQMYSLAKYINQEYGHNICDLVVYKDDQNMRLPLQYKYNETTKTMNNTLLQIASQSRFSDFIVQNVQPHHIDLSNPIAFANKPHFSAGNHKQANSKAISFLMDTYGLDCELKNGQIKPKTKPYQCPVGNCQHSSHNLRVNGNKIACFSQNCKGKFIDIPESEEVDVRPTQKIMKNAVLQNQQYVHYNIAPYRFTFVKSQMNTGKTFKLTQQLANYADYFQIVVSFRRTFAIDFSRKMNFVNYQDLPAGKISLKENPRLCIQIDSLHRVNLEQVNLKKCILVLDEIESTLDQSDAFSHKPQVQQSLLSLVNLLQCVNKVIVLDAMLEQRSVDLLNTLAKNENYQIIHNTYQPKSGFTAQIIQGAHTDAFKADFQQNVMNTLQSGQKVVSFCSSIEILRGVVQLAESQGYKVKQYHGIDAKYEKCHDGKNMAQAKTEDFKDLRNIACDLLIYTSTITAGISYEDEHFDRSINYYAYNTCSPIQVVQALQRVRKLTDQNIVIYLDKTQHKLEYKTSAELSASKVFAYQKFFTYDIVRELTIYLESRMQQQMAFKNTILLTLLADQGFDIKKVVTEYTKTKLVIAFDDVDYSLQITENDVQLLEQLKQQDFILKSTDKQLESKIHLAMIMKLYGLTLENLNGLEAEQKQLMYKNKDIQIEINAWKYIRESHNLSELSVQQAISLVRARESEINKQNRWFQQVTNSMTQKQVDSYGNRLKYLIHSQKIINLSPDDLGAYIKQQSSTFVRSYNQLLQPFGLSIKVKQSNNVKTYEIQVETEALHI